MPTSGRVSPFGLFLSEHDERRELGLPALPLSHGPGSHGDMPPTLDPCVVESGVLTSTDPYQYSVNAARQFSINPGRMASAVRSVPVASSGAFGVRIDICSRIRRIDAGRPVIHLGT
jgi:hypothetical protein